MKKLNIILVISMFIVVFLSVKTHLSTLEINRLTKKQILQRQKNLEEEKELFERRKKTDDLTNEFYQKALKRLDSKD